MFSKLHGVFAVIKPTGITCAALGNRIKEMLLQDIPSEEQQMWHASTLRLGHGGTLDLSAEGVLAIGIGAGCKQLKSFIHGDKEYICRAKLGEETDTFNSDGNITGTAPYDHVTREELENELVEFIGSRLQTPPVYSALKHKGQRLSDLARSGQPIPDIKPRPVIMHSVRCTDFDLPYFSLEVKCGGGFYIRSLVHDLGLAVDSCAHVVKLERTKHGFFTNDDALTMSDITIQKVGIAMKLARQKLRLEESKNALKRRKDTAYLEDNR